MTDNNSKQLPGAWQNTPTRPNSSIDPPIPSSDKPTTSIPHVPSAELRQHDAHSMTDVTSAIRRIRQLREEVLLEKRGTSPRDERHNELEERLASLEKEEQDALHREEREKQTDELMMKTLEEERLLREHMQHYPSSNVSPTWEERLQMAEAQRKTSLPIDHTIVRQTQSSAETQAIMSAFAQLSKDLTNQINQFGFHLEQVKGQLDSHSEQVKGQIGQLSSRIDDIETSSNRSRSRSRSNHSLQRRPMTNENSRHPGLPVTVEEVEDERNVSRSLFRTKFRKVDPNTNRFRTKESYLHSKQTSLKSVSIIIESLPR